MERRIPRVYFSDKTQDRKAILVFDAGHAGGDVHIYERKETRQAKEIEEGMKAHLNTDKIPKDFQMDIVRMWVEKEFGYSTWWKLTPE